MDIFSSEPREPLFVPSFFCQSLLGKAVQEHFTKPQEVASVFSSSPSLQNSSAGANFLTNFRIRPDNVQLFETVFTPEDCFSIQFTPSLTFLAYNFNEQSWDIIFNFLFKNLIKTTKYLEASLRSLTIKADLVTDEQLRFILSHLRRITKLDMILHFYDGRITSRGIRAIGENLTELIELRIQVSDALDDSVLQLFESKLKKMTKLVLEACSAIGDNGVLAISKMESLTSLSLRSCGRIS
jgi:hypothetical protein